MTGTLIGTILVHVQIMLETNVQLWSAAFILFYVGYMSGGFLCALLFDRFNWEMLFFIFASLLAGLVGLCYFVTNFWHFVVLWTLANSAMGYIDAG